MPLRALMGFGLDYAFSVRGHFGFSLNALTGIDGIWTKATATFLAALKRSLNALTGIDGIWTQTAPAGLPRPALYRS